MPRHWIIISYGQIGCSRTRERKLSERLAIGAIPKLPNIRRKRARTLILICLRLISPRTRVKHWTKTGERYLSLNGFRARITQPDWAISIQFQKSAQPPPLVATWENTCSKRVLTKFGLQAGGASAIRKIGLMSSPLYRSSWLYYYHRGIGGKCNCWDYDLRRKHPLSTNWQNIT